MTSLEEDIRALQKVRAELIKKQNVLGKELERAQDGYGRSLKEINADIDNIVARIDAVDRRISTKRQELWEREPFQIELLD